jgi:ferric-dicitrate binding protein FerR (iron transport regulator)
VSDDYLWERGGPADADVERLERALAPQRWSGRIPALPPRPRRRPWIPALALAAAAAALIVLPLVLDREAGADRDISYRVETLAGAPRVESRSHDELLRPGDALVTDARSRARVEIAELGDVVLEPGTRLRVERPQQGAAGAEHLLFLERGTVAASIFAAPRVFQVGTPAGIAVDLGCIYTASVEEGGATRLAVVSGQVSFEADGRRAIVPSGAWCRALPGAGPGPAFREDAPEALVEAVARLLAAALPSPAEIERVLDAARPGEDALTLWHLLEHPSEPVRVAVYGALAAVEPPPEGADRAALTAGDRAALDRWRHAMSWSW